MSNPPNHDVQDLQFAVFAAGVKLFASHPLAGFWFDLSMAGGVWQIDVWRGTTLEMRQRGGPVLLARRITEWVYSVDPWKDNDNEG